MEINLNVNVKFLNSLMDVSPPWAIEMKELVTTLMQKGIEFMATAQEKLTELEGLVGGMKGSLDGISADLQSHADQRAADAAEIASLKQAVIDAQSGAGELDPALAARFDALKASMEAASQQATELDARLPNIPETPVEPDPAPVDPAPTE